MYQWSTITLLQIDKKTETPSINITWWNYIWLIWYCFHQPPLSFFRLVKLGRLPSSVRPGLLHPSPVVERIYLLKVCLFGGKNETSEKKKKDPKSDKYYTNHQDLVQFQSANLSNSAAISPQARPRSYLQLLIYCPQDCRSLCAAYVRQLGNPVASRRSIFFLILEVR